MMSKLIFFLFILFPIVVGAQVLTVEEAAKIGIENNFDIIIAAKRAEISENNNSFGNAGYLPSVDITGSAEQSIDDVRQDRSDGSSVTIPGAVSTSLQAQAGVNWVIFDGFGMFAAKDRLSREEEAEKLRLKSQIENKLLEIYSVYYDIVRIKNETKVRQQAVNVSRERVRIMNDRFELGNASKLNLLQAQVDLNSDIADSILAVTVIENRKIDLNKVLGRDPNTEFDVDTLLQLTDISGINELLASVKENNTEVKIAEKNIEISQEITAENRSELLPEVNLFGGYSYFNSKSDYGFATYNRNHGWNFGLGLSYNIFNGFNTDRRIENSLIEQDIQRTELNLITNDMLALVGKNYNEYKNYLALAELRRTNVDVARENFEISRERLDLGMISPVEYRDAQRNFTQAQNELVNAIYNAKVKELNLMLLSGRLLDESE